MKDNRGFTLIEILGVIVIIAAISLLAFPPILEQIRKSHSKISGATLDLVYTGADLYIDSQKSNYWKNNGNTYCITLRSIVDKGFLNDPITDTMTNQTLDLDSSVVKAVYSNNKFQYSLVTDGSCVEKSLITFEDKMRSSSEVMNNDPDQNLRYVGSDPKNYVWFNNELWRIIGLFDEQVKIIRAEYYGTQIMYDNNDSNNWETVSLKVLLNDGNTSYLKTIETNDETSYGYIDLEHVWNIGAYDSSYTTMGTRSVFYTTERSETPASSEGSEATWTGAIGLMYPSDFGYATNGDTVTCDSVAMWSWHEENYKIECAQRSWLYDSSYTNWTITPRSDYLNCAFGVSYSGRVYNHYVYGNLAVLPVLYLQSNVGIVSGIGTSGDPFVLGRIGE